MQRCQSNSFRLGIQGRTAHHRRQEREEIVVSRLFEPSQITLFIVRLQRAGTVCSPQTPCLMIAAYGQIVHHRNAYNRI